MDPIQASSNPWKDIIKEKNFSRKIPISLQELKEKKILAR